VTAGGALLASCVQDTCASGLVTCGCIQSCVQGGCSLLGSATAGFTVYCGGSCPQATCA
jgi:hypothetical protein